MKSKLNRRAFLGTAGSFVAGSLMASPLSRQVLESGQKIKAVLVGTGVRGTSFWGKTLVENFPDILEFVGLCDVNPGRLEYAARYMGVDCPLFADFEKMILETTPNLVIVTTKDSTHHEFIIKGLDMGCDVLTEKPLTTDQDKCQAILDAERRSKGKVIVGFNYRWGPYMTKIKELLQNGSIGKVTSVDFHWYLNTYHGASYFRRWHGLRQSGGTLWVHKATHHFDLLNWWLDSDPEEVFAYGDLEYYGSNGPFRGDKCRTCSHKSECKFYWDITLDKRAMDLYVNNEQYDGYIRDKCLFRPEVNIYDKMSAQIKYSDNTLVNYSLTTYSPFEGWKIAFNGTEGRIDAWLDIPFMKGENISQSDMHEVEMSQGDENLQKEPVILHKLWNDHEVNYVSFSKGGHGGGDKLLHDQVFRTPDKKDPYDRAAGIRDGALSILIGIAARKSIESGTPVRIATLSDLEPRKENLMEALNGISLDLSALVDTWEPLLRGLSSECISDYKNEQDRSIRQIVGHMFDSASNNTHRIVHLQYQESPISYPDYANLGNNDRWIAIQNYQKEDWENLVTLWAAAHRHIAHVIRQADPEKLDAIWVSALGEEVSLQAMITDFPRHFSLHISEIEGLLKQSKSGIK